MVNFKPIPELRELKSWESIPILECGEKLIPMSKLPEKYFIMESMYYLQNIPGATKEIFAREGVCDLLVKAARNLPRGYRFLIWDVWRPIEVQSFIYYQYFNELKRERAALDEEQLHQMAKLFVALPSLDEKKPSPHNTGGAIDLSLVDESGIEVDMKTSFDSFSNESRTRFFEEKVEKGEKLSSEEVGYCNNRRLLYYLLNDVGFSNYPHEWWHYDYGNQFWGKSTNHSAIYGKISP